MMPAVSYDVDLIRQEANPICWVACCAMVKGWGTKTSVGVGNFTGGFDPSNSCIANLAGRWQDCVAMMDQWGFDVFAPGDLASSGPITGYDLWSALNSKSGPALLLHLCNGFPYGSQWAPLNSGAHAVVVTSVDTDANRATFNNPWGDKDQAVALDILVAKVNGDAGQGKTLGFWRL